MKQSFSGAIGGVAPAISPSGNADRPFLVKGNQFRTFADAWERSCGEQKNICGDFANSADGRSKGVTVNQCDQQNGEFWTFLLVCRSGKQDVECEMGK